MFKRLKSLVYQINPSLQHVQNRELILSYWLPNIDRKALARKLLVHHKLDNLTDHLCYGMMKHLGSQYSNIAFARFDPDKGDPKRKNILHMAIQKQQPAYVFAYGNPVDLDDVQVIKAQGSRLAVNNIRIHSFYCGDTYTQSEAIEIKRGYDCYFVSHAPHVARLRQEGINAFHIPMGYDPNWFHPLPNEELLYDVLFVGSIKHHLNENRADLLAHLANYFHVTVISHDKVVDNVDYVCPVTNPYELNRIFNQARIVIGSDRLNTLEILNSIPGQYIFYDDEFYIRQRVYPITGAGACYGVERHPEIMRQYDDGSEILLWDSYEELTEKIDYYLKNDDERREVAHRGYLRASSNYTISHVVGQMLEIMGLSVL